MKYVLAEDELYPVYTLHSPDRQDFDGSPFYDERSRDEAIEVPDEVVEQLRAAWHTFAEAHARLDRIVAPNRIGGGWMHDEEVRLA